jgi:DNA-binding SARP family transcriptional activator
VPEPSDPGGYPEVALSLQILGPLRIWRGGVELDPGPRQQARLLAVLLARAAQPTSTAELIDLIWGEDPPASAVNVLHKYIGALRRLFDASLTTRRAESYLRRRGDGYMFVPDPGGLDLVTFREHVEAAKVAVAGRRHEAGVDRYLEALQLWRGPAGAGEPRESSAMALFVALENEFFGACLAAAGLAVMSGRLAQVLPALQIAAKMAPLHEPIQASLIDALYAAGHRAEALAVFYTIRARLDEDLGITPGAALAAAHRRVLTAPVSPKIGRPPHDDERGMLAGKAGFVGRAGEIALLLRAVRSAVAGETGVVIVEGEPGVGKTSLLEEVAAEAERRGVLVVWGVCLEGGGTPSMWPWLNAVGALLQTLPAPGRNERLAGALGHLLKPSDDLLGPPRLLDGGAQFRMFEEVVSVVGQVAAQRPALIVVDDLQWADVTSLRLFSHLGTRLPAATTLMGVLRDRAPAPSSELSQTLSKVSRAQGHRRLRLKQLNLDEVTELVRRETGQEPDPAAVDDIYARTEGNAFFVRELCRLLADRGALTENVTRAGVPSAVRDIVRIRTADLGDEVHDLLQVAAVAGRTVALAVLAHATGSDVATCLDRLDPLEGLGVLGPVPGDPFSFRFAHDLSREAISEMVPRGRAASLHLRIADALEQTNALDESVAERTAFHLWAAGPVADPVRTAEALLRAGRHAAAKSAFEAAQRHLQSAVQVARTARLAELELSALSLLGAVFLRQAGFTGSYFELLERAEHLARGLGMAAEAADFLFIRMVASWSALRPDRFELSRRLFDIGMTSADPVLRGYGQLASGESHWDRGDIDTGLEHFTEGNNMMSKVLVRKDENLLRYDMQRYFGLPLQATLAALHGDIDGAQAMLDAQEAAAGDDIYAVAVWAHYTTMTAAMIGDPTFAKRAAQRWISANLGSFSNVSPYVRTALCWIRALSGGDASEAAVEADQILTTTMVDPPLHGVPFYQGLLAEMWLAAGRTAEAGVALDRAQQSLDAYGQRYAEGLLLLLRARLMQAGGEPVAAVEAAAEKSRSLAAERGNRLFVRRADEFLASLRGERRSDRQAEGKIEPAPVAAGVTVPSSLSSTS